MTVFVITKTYLYNLFFFFCFFLFFFVFFLQGCILYFLISAQNIDCGYSLEPPRRGGSNEYPQSMCLSRNMKNIRTLSENFQFLVVKFSIYLNRLVFITNM